MTGVVKRRHPRQNAVVPEDFLMVFRDEVMNYKGELNISVVAFWQG